MCMTCGCGEADKRHHPTDITREDLQRAADGAGSRCAQAAKNLAHSTDELEPRHEPPTSGRIDDGAPASSVGRRA